MAPFYTFSPKTTTISFSWPKELSGLERVALSSQGDLQRVLSAFFARPIVLALIYSNTFTTRLTMHSFHLRFPILSRLLRRHWSLPSSKTDKSICNAVGSLSAQRHPL
ncbi:hypothetical protein B0H10DRAFT_2306156 [Mycena sp. CBHHK59/15]|nr:hypothetical protein B0H10DRAFT_2306156 [Mycena sp. CBHHK59/15]